MKQTRRTNENNSQSASEARQKMLERRNLIKRRDTPEAARNRMIERMEGQGKTNY